MERRRSWTLLGVALGALLLVACRDECDDLCDGLDAYRRFACTKPPAMLCNHKGEAAPPLSVEEVAHVRRVKENCKCK